MGNENIRAFGLRVKRLREALIFFDLRSLIPLIAVYNFSGWGPYKKTKQKIGIFGG